MSKELKFDQDTVGDALPRILELVSEPGDLFPWYEQVGIDQDFLYSLAYGMQEAVGDTVEMSAESIIMGVALAWEVARGQR
jgi:hypothetical protein